MAEGLLKTFDPHLEVHSAGTQPADRVHPAAVQVMREVGIDISANRPKNVDLFLTQPFDFVITVCDDAKEACPAFTGQVKRRAHIGFQDPAKAAGAEQQVIQVFRRVRDQITERLRAFYDAEIRKRKSPTLNGPVHPESPH
jgi:arsenate reductase